MRAKLSVILTVFMVMAGSAIAQDRPPELTKLDHLISEGEYQNARSHFNHQVRDYYSMEQYDSLAWYVPYAGRIAGMTSSADHAVQEAEAFIQKLADSTSNPGVLRRAWIQLSEFYDESGMYQSAYESNQKALEYSKSIRDIDPREIAEVRFNLGVWAMRTGDYGLSADHHKKAVELFKSDPKSTSEDYYLIYNALGGVMWYSSRIDSARIYYEKALDYLSEMEDSPENKFYRKAIVQNNIAALFNISGEISRSMQTMRKVVHNFDYFSVNYPDHPSRLQSLRYKFQAVENLATLYIDMGNYSRALELLEAAYHEKKEIFEESDPEMYNSLLLLGNVHRALYEHKKAMEYYVSALKLTSQLEGEYPTWVADLYYSMALTEDALNNKKQADTYFTSARQLYEASFRDSYDDIYIDFLNNMALFYAEHGEFLKARETAMEGYEYIRSTRGTATLLEIRQILSVAEVFLVSNEMEAAKSMADEALKLIESREFERQTLLDSIHVELQKPRAILLKSKADYATTEKRDVIFLKNILQDLEEALSILESRKPNMLSNRDVGILIESNRELFDFTKKILAALYLKSEDNRYLNRLLMLHESQLYGQIRNRLNKRENFAFFGVPDSVIHKEHELREELSSVLTGGTDNIHRFFNLEKQWDRFLSTLKERYPRYYRLRYETIIQSPGGFPQVVPEETSIVRYMYIDKQLYAVVLNDNQSDLYKLEFEVSEPPSRFLSKHHSHQEIVGSYLHSLYQSLWEPFESAVLGKRVMIIPDGNVFNVSFDILTPEKIKSFSELAEKSLVSSYDISYQYSLLLLVSNEVEKTFKDSYVGFAPGFTDSMKSSGLITDQNRYFLQEYQRLLPQPFSVGLVQKFQKTLGGKSYLFDQSTKENFRRQAGNHQIIHIGTHAESDNISPEYSRLIFAKSDSSDDHSLYVHEIYNLNLTSELALLSACETGKPTYQPGEGMISLAHAFNYAGSSSMLTALWNIDEKASAVIQSNFLDYLSQGMAKDEALRRAKLKFLEEADGRELSPIYWSGLALIGNVDPVHFKSDHFSLAGVVAVILIAGILLAVAYRKIG